jgi:hypothetical protein
MNDSIQRPNYSMEFKRRLINRIKVYMKYCWIHKRSDKKVQIKEFYQAYGKCIRYFNSELYNLEVKQIVEKVLLGKPLLLAILPRESSLCYRKALQDYNDIVQHCMDELRSCK